MKTCPQCSKTYDDTFDICPDDATRLTSTLAAPAQRRLLDNRYELMAKIGEGGMGAIYKAVHAEMGRTCAIKLLTAISTDNDEAIARFKREAKMASRIDNAHAVTIYDFGESEDGTLFLAMEFIDGKPLSNVIRQHKTLPLDRVVHITSQIADGLAAAHAMEIVHRDLKPDNIMITSKGGDNSYVKVLDFGIAKTTSEEGEGNLTKTGFVLGTPFYMSPEQLLGEKLDSRSDIYSLAIIVYEMLCGQLPFTGDNPQSVMMKRVMGDPIPLHKVMPSISPEVEQVVMAGLARDREKRTPTAQAFAQGLALAQRGATQVIGVRPTGQLADEKTDRATNVLTGSSQSPDADSFLTSGSTVPLHSLSTPEKRVAATSPNKPALTQQPEISKQPEAAKPVENRPVSQAMPPTEVVSSHIPPPVVQYPVVPPVVAAIGSTPKKNSSIAIRVVAALIVVAVIGGIAFYALSSGKLGGSGSGSTSAKLMVRGAPAGSKVFINDAERGTTASDGTLTLSDLAAGNLTVRISHEGYADFNTSVTGEAGKEAPVTALLMPLEIKYSGSTMRMVPAGEFTMGSDNDDDDEKPAHTISLPGFYIDKYEVTNAEYKRFCQETGRTPPPNPEWDPDYFNSKPDYPVLGVQFKDAADYAAWAGKRLPTEAEWEKAASWDPATNKKLRFPWGIDPSLSRTNIASGKPVTVTQLAKDVSPYGVYGMAGNVAEWVDALYKPYPGNDRPDTNYEKNYGVTRGASFQAGSKIEQGRASLRNPWPRVFPEGKTTPVGIRCAISADDPKLLELISRNK